jgi:hypothetical protein
LPASRPALPYIRKAEENTMPRTVKGVEILVVSEKEIEKIFELWYDEWDRCPLEVAKERIQRRASQSLQVRAEEAKEYFLRLHDGLQPPFIAHVAPSRFKGIRKSRSNLKATNPIDQQIKQTRVRSGFPAEPTILVDGSEEDVPGMMGAIQEEAKGLISQVRITRTEACPPDQVALISKDRATGKTSAALVVHIGLPGEGDLS